MGRILKYLRMNRIQLTSNDTLNGQFKGTNTYAVHACRKKNENDINDEVKCDENTQVKSSG